MKILISAYACNPYKGSEEGVGWGWITAIARNHKLWVLTADFHRADIETAIAKDPDRYHKIRFCYIPHKPWHYYPEGLWLKIEKSLFKPLMHMAYNAWLRDAGQLGAALHCKVGFDLVHQITYVGFRFPGHLWKLNIPYIWGPIGGLVNVPWRLLPVMGFRGALEYGVRNIVNTIHKFMLTNPKKALKKANKLIAATSGVRDEIIQWYGCKSQVICEIGPPPERASKIVKRGKNDVFKIAWSGEHLPGKAMPLLLKALTGIADLMEWRLDILGNGPLSQTWRRKATKYGLSVNCHWQGWVPRDKALRIMQNAHVFVVTSLKDLTSTVLLEALAQGVPVICPDHCGFADVVTNDCGILIDMKSPQQFSTDLSKAIIALYNDEDERRRLAKGALQRIKDYSWDKKVGELEYMYQQAVNEHTAYKSF